MQLVVVAVDDRHAAAVAHLRSVVELGDTHGAKPHQRGERPALLAMGDGLAPLLGFAPRGCVDQLPEPAHHGGLARTRHTVADDQLAVFAHLSLFVQLSSRSARGRSMTKTMTAETTPTTPRMKIDRPSAPLIATPTASSTLDASAGGRSVSV